MAKKPKRRRPVGPVKLSAAAVKAAGPIVLEGELAPEDWSDLQAAAEDGAPRVPSFRMVAYRGGVMRPRMSMGIYGDGVVVDLATARVVPGQMPIHYVHDTTDPVGHAETVEIAATVAIAGKLSVPGPSRDKIVGGAINGFRWRPSISARNFELERLLPDQTATVNGRRIRGPVMIARRAEIYETSFLSVAGDPTATATVSASAADDLNMTFAQFLAACGVTADNLTDDQRTLLQAAYDAQYGDDDNEPGPVPVTPNGPAPGTGTPNLSAAAAVAEQNRLFAENQRRVAQINTLCAGAGSPTIEVNGQQTDLAAHAIESNMSPTEVELHILRNARPRGPAVHSRSREDFHNLEAMTAAVLLASGIELDSPHFQSREAMYMGVPSWLRAGVNSDQRQRIMEAGHAYGSVNMQDLAVDVIEMTTGNRIRGRENIIQAAASSGSLSQVYAASVGASMLVGFMEAAGTLREWSGQDFVSDFKQVQRFNEDAEASLEYLPPNGEAAHATAGAKFEYLKADIYARQYVIDRYAYVNNDLGMIGRKPRKMGEAARRLEEDFGYSVLLSNPTMQSTGRALFNTTDGTLHTSHALTRSNAEKAIAYTMNRQDGESTLDLMVGWALTPTELGDLADRIFTSEYIEGSDASNGTRNTIRKHGVQTVRSPRLSNGVKHPKTKTFATGSTTDWYTIAKNTEVAQRVYLTETGGVPVVRVTQLTQGKWGQHIDVAFDFGFGFVTFRGADKFQA